jgi:hypothetical protein
VEKSLFRMFQLGPLITNVIYCGSEASDSGHLLCAGAMCHPTATRSLLSTTPSSSGISATPTDLPIPATSSCLQCSVATSGLLLPASNGQGPVRPQEFPAQLDYVKSRSVPDACWRFLTPPLLFNSIARERLC